MNIEIINKLDEITSIIENDIDLLRMKKLKKEILNNKGLMTKINTIKEMPTYNEEYLKLKKEILNNNNFEEFKKIENDTFLFIQSINKKLNSLREKSECR